MLAERTGSYEEYSRALDEAMEKDIAQKGAEMPARQSAAGTEYLLLQLEAGQISPKLEWYTRRYLAEHPKVLFAYTDEEAPGALPVTPRYKPSWSPDTFAHTGYWGGLAILRKSWTAGCRLLPGAGDAGAFLDLSAWKPEQKQRLLVQLAQEAGGYEKGCETIGLIDGVLFTRDEAWQPGEILPGEISPSAAEDMPPLVSVVIPSKDNPALVQSCLEALHRTSGACSYEVIVVDNGSSAANKSRIEAVLANQPVPAKYLYEPMPFHFAKMCNLGAEAAAGAYLLFLNDDVELKCAGTMARLQEQAAKTYCGAVGLKLYYPGSVRIQHAGIVNLPMGPVHKLQFLQDDTLYYDGYNRMDRNVLAVTGACLMVAKEKYAQAGGMCEDLPVAFNDVDLCFTLRELGYHNTVLNSLYGWHHESLSRGGDEAPQKLARLLSEKAKLYARHPLFADGFDPYYSRHLNREGLDTTIRPGYVTAKNALQEIGAVKSAETKSAFTCQTAVPAGYREDACLLLRVERCEEACVQGYSVVLGSDNACFEWTVILERVQEADAAEKASPGNAAYTEWEGSPRFYTAPLTRQYRPELIENMADQQNVALCGFWWRPVKGSLPAGAYRVGVLAKSRIDGTKLVNWSSRTLQI